MIDENAFGILISYYGLENDEYGLERAEFVARFEAFRASVRATVAELPLGDGVRAVDLGHALYVEVADGDQSESPLSWARKAHGRLAERGFDAVVVVTHGGRWVDEAAESFTSTEHIGQAGLVTVSLPSEPLRRALYAETAAHTADESDEGWGPGLYLDVEAVEALGMKPRNAPTSLRIGGAEFYRVGG